MSSVYIHIPFCHGKCAYCDFYSTPSLRDVHAVVGGIVDELRMRRTEVPPDVRTVYIGGGTPSILPADELRRIVDALGVEGLDEFTIEVNPEDVTLDKVEAWRSLGIDRVSMGVQSLVDGELAVVGRRHTAADALRAVDALRLGGMANISLDLIYGLPTQTLDSWRYSLNRLLDFSPEHLSAYMLSYEPRTRLSAMLDKGVVSAVDEDTLVAMYRLLVDTCRDRGYLHYEISNFSKPGFKALHNSSYWSSTPYLGLGPSAHSFDGKVRRVNPSSIRDYIAAINAGVPAYVVEPESKVDRANDTVITALRTAEGLDLKRIPVRYRRALLCAAYQYVVSGAVEIIDDRLRIPEPSWLVSDAIMRDLLLMPPKQSHTSKYKGN